jgi:hypothetical protein
LIAQAPDSRARTPHEIATASHQGEGKRHRHPALPYPPEAVLDEDHLPDASF